MKVNIGPYRKNRKIDVRIDPHDTWNMNSTLAHIILPMLKQLKESKRGSPLMSAHTQTSTNSTQFCFDFYEEGDDYAWEAGHKQWEEIMDKMIWAFEQVNIFWEKQYESGEVDFTWEKIANTDFSTLKHGSNHTYIYDFEGARKHSERMQEGFDLFGEYYNSLWD
jgi:hypothetical protein